MSAGLLRILIVEDNPADAQLLEHELRRGGLEFQSSRVDSETEYIAALSAGLDLVLCDWQLPQFDGLRALSLLQASQSQVPFILVSGSIGEEAAVNVMKLGASDYLLKDRLGRLVPVIRQALAQRDYQRSVDQAASAVRQSEERYRRLMDVLPNAVLINSGGKIVFCNPNCVRLFGATDASQLLGRDPFELFHPDYHLLIQQRISTMLEQDERVAGIEEKIVRLDGRVVPVHVIATPIMDCGARAVLVALSDLTERERSTSLLRSVLDSVNDAILTIDDCGTIYSANPATERMFGYAQSELVGQSIRLLMPSPYHEHHNEYIADYIRTGINRMIGIGREVTGRRRDGSVFPLELTVAEFELDGQRRFTGVVRDITARKRLEEQFHQAQKMEAIGQLAGGIAHDFNNLLTVINGYAQLLLADEPNEDIRSRYTAHIREAGERAAGLTAQLLAFSRKTILEPRVIDVNLLIEQLGRMLSRLIGEDITFVTILKPNLSCVTADPGQLEQVIMNLAVNARDAMPHGGRLTIETSEIVLEPNDLPVSDLQPGCFVQIRMTDTGTGISPEVQSRMFEPFYTTKEVGHGTGLGLATAYGIIKQTGGYIDVDSEPGKGASFRILLAAVSAGPNTDKSRLPQTTASVGSETIMIVEDEPAVLKLVRTILESNGFHVISATDGPSALATASTYAGNIDLLLTDVVMPDMSGREMAQSFRERWPKVKVLYTSGYTADTVVRYGVETAADAFIQKPFTPVGLARKVRQTLDVP
jgi:two-component system cell cycle sensor histidine kinase/response regulator CckA